MTLEEAMEDVRGMISCVKPGPSKPRQADLMREGGFEWIFEEDAPSGIAKDSNPHPWRVDEAKLPGVIENAWMDPYALDAVESLVDLYIFYEKPLPVPLAQFLRQTITEGIRRRKMENPDIRADDEFLAMLVNYLVRNAHLKPTRNMATSERKSACDQVAEAWSELKRPISYDKVAKAWDRYK